MSDGLAVHNSSGGSTLRVHMPSLMSLILLLIVARPIIDLMGRYQAGKAVNPGGVLAVVLSFLCLLEFLLHLRRVKADALPGVLAMTGVFLVQSLALATSTDRNKSFLSLLRIVTGFLVILIVPILAAMRREDLEKLLWKFYLGFLGVMSVPIVIAWLQLAGLYPATNFDYYAGGAFGRPSGGYESPPELVYRLLFLIILTYLFQWKQRLSGRVKSWIVGICVLTTFISTLRTGIIIALLLVLIVETVNLVVLNRFRVRRSVIRACLAFLFGLTALPFVLNYVFKIDLQKKIEALPIDAAYRVIFESSGLGTTLDPTDIGFMRGRGSMYRHTLDDMSGDVMLPLFGTGYEPVEAHIDVGRMWLSTGFVGLFLYLFFFAWLYGWTAVRADRRGRFLLNLIYLYLIVFGLTYQPSGFTYFMWLFFLSHVFVIAYFPRAGHAPESAAPPDLAQA